MKLRSIAYGPGQEELAEKIASHDWPSREQARNRRLVAKYGLTAVEYDAMLDQQGGGCAICGSTAKTRRLHVDHDHKWTQVKLVYSRESDGEWKVRGAVRRLWQVHARYNGQLFWARYGTRREAVKDVRQRLKRASVRGILCFGCNGGLRKFRDNPLFMERAAKYITRFTQNEQRV